MCSWFPQCRNSASSFLHLLIPHYHLSLHPLPFLQYFSPFIHLFLCLMAISPVDFKLCEGKNCALEVLHCTVSTYTLSGTTVSTPVLSLTSQSQPQFRPCHVSSEQPSWHPDKSSCLKSCSLLSILPAQTGFSKYRCLCTLPPVRFLNGSLLPSG